MSRTIRQVPSDEVTHHPMECVPGHDPLDTLWRGSMVPWAATSTRRASLPRAAHAA